MRKIILFAVFTILCSIVSAQKYYTSESGSYTVQTEDGAITYNYINNTSYYIKLYRSTNKFTGQYERMKDGLPLPAAIVYGRDPLYRTEIDYDDMIKEMVYAGLSKEQRDKVEPVQFSVEMRIDTETGYIAEIEFEIGKRSVFAELPPEYYYDLEEQIRSSAKLRWNLTPTGKQLKFFSRFWFEDYPDSYYRQW